MNDIEREDEEWWTKTREERVRLVTGSEEDYVRRIAYATDAASVETIYKYVLKYNATISEAVITDPDRTFYRIIWLFRPVRVKAGETMTVHPVYISLGIPNSWWKRTYKSIKRMFRRG